MTRFKAQWLDDEGREPDAVPEQRFRLTPQRSSRRRTPATPPERERGLWLDAEREPNAATASVDTEFEQWRPAHEYPAPKWPGIATALAGLAAAVLLIIGVAGNTNVLRGMIVLPFLAYGTYAIAQRFAKIDGQPAIVSILMGGFAVKFLGILLRYFIGLQVYGRSDATEYVSWGQRIAGPLRHFELIDIGRLRGTNFIRLVTGIVFAVTPGSAMVAFFVFGFFSFVGMLFFWRAFKMSFPGVNDLRYLQVIVVLPSLAFWPSSVGKDAWMVMGVGIASYGVACILTNRTLTGWIAFVLGMWALLAVRPHVAIAMLVGLVVAELFRSRGSQGAGRAALSILLLFLVGSVVMSTASAFLGIDNWSKASVDQELNSVTDRTSEGRSEFTPTPVNSPVQFPQGAFTVLFRPMPYEAQSPQELASSFENVAFLVVLIVFAPRIWNALKKSRARPYLLYCLGTIIVFVVEFSSFSNFALIARQRTTITALMLVFVCLPQKELAQVDLPTVRSAQPKPTEDDGITTTFVPGIPDANDDPSA
jgi:hypothetical protein